MTIVFLILLSYNVNCCKNENTFNNENKDNSNNNSDDDIEILDV